MKIYSGHSVNEMKSSLTLTPFDVELSIFALILLIKIYLKLYFICMLSFCREYFWKRSNLTDRRLKSELFSFFIRKNTLKVINW